MRIRTLALAAALAVAAPLSAQSLMGDMHSDVNEVQRKLVDLAKAIPQSSYDWRPGPGVRSVGEVFLHVATDNYLIPSMMGTPAPASTKIDPADMKSVEAFEKQKLTKDQIIAALEASFVHLHKAMGTTTDANLGEKINFFEGV